MACLTIDELNRLKPCPESGRRVRALLRKLNADKGHCFTAAEAREAGCTFDDIVWAASAVARSDKSVERKLRHWMADCAARVLHLYERDYPADDRPRKAIEAARLYTDGKIADAVRAAARDAARDAAWDASAAARAAARDAAWAAAWDASAAARAAARDAAWAAAWDASAAARAARDAARDARDAARDARDAARAAAWAAEEAYQFDRLVMWLSDDEPEPLPLPAPVAKAA